MNLPIDLVEPGQRLRSVSAAKVAELVASIRDVGLLNPITVYPRQLYRGGVQVNGFGLIAGAHRLEAFRQMGRTEIPATALHPELRQGASKGEGGKFKSVAKIPADEPQRQLGGTVERPEIKSFSADTAQATGISERTIQREAERGEKVIPEVMDLVHGTPLDTGIYLDRLKKLSPNDQVFTAKRDLAFDRRRQREATPEHKAREKAKRMAGRLIELWTRAPEDARTLFKKQAGLVGIVPSKPTESRGKA